MTNPLALVKFLICLRVFEMENLLILALILLSLCFWVSAAVLIRLFGDLLKDYQNTKYVWICLLIVLITAPALVFIVRVLTLTQMCGD